MKHTEGIPMIMRALEVETKHMSPVQVIAELDLGQLLDMSGVAQDPLWSEILLDIDEAAARGSGDAVVLVDSAAGVRRVLTEALCEVLELKESTLGKQSVTL